MGAALYCMGLLGDSYYGLIVETPVLRNVYQGIFTVMENTRNGIFMAPLFLLMGANFPRGVSGEGKKAGVRSGERDREGSGVERQQEFLLWGLGLALSLALMTVEGLWLHMAGWPHHDSMYFFLPAVMLFLFGILLRLPMKPQPGLRRMSLWIYLLHPALIVAVRGFAGITGTEELLVENHLVHFLCVAAASLVTAYLLSLPGRKGSRDGRTYGKGRQPEERSGKTSENVSEEIASASAQISSSGKRAWMEVSAEALLHNMDQFRSILHKDTRMMAVVKADGYGHGALWTAKQLQAAGVRDFAVATVSEGVALRRGGINGNILILGYTNPEDWPEVSTYELIQTIVDGAYAREMNRYGCGHEPLRAHLAVDTGMHRPGVAADDRREIEEIFRMQGIRPEGVFSHLCVADSHIESDEKYTRKQIEKFEEVRRRCEAMKAGLTYHLQSSFGVLNYPELHYDFVRSGNFPVRCLQQSDGYPLSGT